VRRILVVDNDPELLGLMQELFEAEGWKVAACTRAAEAAREIERERPDVVLLDLWLETPTAGFDLIDRLAASPAASSIPIVCCTGADPELSSRQEWLEQRCVATVYKPFDIEELTSAVQRAWNVGRNDSRDQGPSQTFQDRRSGS
jgi:DNA-binding response OmpR family regulator